MSAARCLRWAWGVIALVAVLRATVGPPLCAATGCRQKTLTHRPRMEMRALTALKVAPRVVPPRHPANPLVGHGLWPSAPAGAERGPRADGAQGVADPALLSLARTPPAPSRAPPSA